MNTIIKKSLVCMGILAVFASITPTLAAQSINSPAAKPVQSGLTLTLSTVPYSTDPNSDYVRIYCAPKNKKEIKQSKKQ